MEVCGFLSKKAPISVACITSIYDNILILSVWICSSSNKENSRVAEQLWSIVHSPWGIGPESRCTCQPARVPFYPKSSSKWEWEKRTNVGRNQQRKKENNVSVDWSLTLNAQNCHNVRDKVTGWFILLQTIRHTLLRALLSKPLSARHQRNVFIFFLAPTFLKILTQNHEGQIKKLLEGVSGDTKRKPNKSWI